MRKLPWGFWKSRERAQMPKRRVHLGIDFGTSTSKIVFRDYGAPGGERAILLLRDVSFRIPSRVCLTATELLFGNDNTPDGCEIYESIKMQAAAEKSGNSNYYFGPTKDRKSTRLNSSHVSISYAVFCLKKKNVVDR